MKTSAFTFLFPEICNQVAVANVTPSNFIHVMLRILPFRKLVIDLFYLRKILNTTYQAAREVVISDSTEILS